MKVVVYTIKGNDSGGIYCKGMKAVYTIKSNEGGGI